MLINTITQEKGQCIKPKKGDTDVLSCANVALYSNTSTIIAFHLSKNDLTYPLLRW